MRRGIFRFGFACAAVLLAMGGQAQAGPLFGASYSADVTFQDQLGSTTMTLAFDGTNYWSGSGGSSDGVRYAQYDAGGSLVSTFSPGLDFRSVFTDSLGNVHARQYSDNSIFSQTSPGVFAPSGVTLGGGFFNDQSAVVFNGNGTEYVANNSGTVYRWDSSGNLLSTVGLSGWGSVAGEAFYPADRGIAAVGDYWLTYSHGVLSAWDASGTRVDQTVLLGAGTSFDSHFSLSYANGRVFIVDDAGGTWRGYDVGLSNVNAVPAPAGLVLLATAAPFAGYFGLRRRKQAVAV